jgi:hypothetical protein
MKAGVVALALVGGLGATLMGGAPAFAITHCVNVDYDQSNGRATADCYGGGQMRFVVHCAAVWPLTPWVKYSPWGPTPVASVVYVFPSCPWPASYSVGIQYR